MTSKEEGTHREPKRGEKREKERRCKLREAGRVCEGREDTAGLVGILRVPCRGVPARPAAV